jgi:hypothetical protein
MSTTSRHHMKFQAVTDKCQVEIVDLKGSYIRTAGAKGAAILDGMELCRVEEFAARHFRRSGFDATFLQTAPIHVITGWPGPSAHHRGGSLAHHPHAGGADIEASILCTWTSLKGK